LAGSTGLAAAGVLPDAAQDAFSTVLDRVGIAVPASTDHPASSGEEVAEIAITTDATDVEKGAEISSVASGGMSQAGQHGSESTAAAIETTGEAPVPVPNEGGTGTGDAASRGSGEAPVPVPNEGGTGTGNTASDGASEEGTVTADEKSGSHSGSGSGNASIAPPTPVVVPEPPAAPAP
jgi:hypothetical protein